MTSWLHERRLDAVREAVLASRARTLLDLGCGDGDLLIRLALETLIDRIVGVDYSLESLERLRSRLDILPEHARARVQLIHGSILEQGAFLSGFDCAMLIETIEHIEPEQLSVLENSVFQGMSPTVVMITTPNADFNRLLAVPSHRYRHPDHRFEWGRAKFQQWTQGVAERNGYVAVFSDLAGSHPVYGGPTQMTVLRRIE